MPVLLHKILFFILSLLISQVVKGQMSSSEEPTSLPLEEITFITDRDIYLSGEKIWFSASCEIDGKPEQTMSRILYVELYNYSHKSVVKNKYRLQKGRANGVLDIPSEFLSGNYFLRAYTQYLKNFPSEIYFTKLITIINPLLPLPAQTKDTQSKIDSLAEGDNDRVIVRSDLVPASQKKIELKTNKEIYEPRELVTLEILNVDGSMDLTVSVVKKGTLFEEDKILTQLPDIISPQSTKSKWLPEIRDVSISGIVIDKQTGLPQTGIPVYLSVGKENPQIHIYRSGEKGEFIFSLNNFERFQEVFLCPLSEADDELEIKIVSDFLPDFPELNEVTFSIDSSQMMFLEQMHINMQASKAFNTEPGHNPLQYSHLPFPFANPPISVVLDDYIETPTMEMVFRELVPRVRVRKKHGIYRLSVFDFDNSLNYTEPLILIDNIPVFEVNELLKIQPAYVEKIEVHNSPLILGDNIILGTIMITTTTTNFGGMIMPETSTFLKYRTLTSSYQFDPPEYNTKEKKQDTKADFRNTLYWDPSLRIKSNTSISFYTSDHLSEYEVIVRGKTARGKQVLGRTGFRVVK